MNVGIVLFGLNNKSCGGAERFFADFFDIYNSQTVAGNRLFFITDRTSLAVYKELGKLKHPERIIIVNEISNRFKNFVEKNNFALKCLFNRIDILHIASYGKHYYSRLKYVDSLPSFFRPKLVLNIVDAELSYTLAEKWEPKFTQYVNKYGPVFNTIKLDGVYSWYVHFKEHAEKGRWIKSMPYTKAIKTRFSLMPRRIQPAAVKNNEFVYAARLIERKRPELFVEAIDILRNIIIPEEFAQWKFKIFGTGPMEPLLKNKIHELNLKDSVTMGFTADLGEVFSKSKCFVSTMDLENFPSQSINEAMATGNAIIARNVGQTDYFVKDGINGILVEDDSPESLASAMKYYIEHPELHDSMQNESIRLTKEVHTPENFIREIDEFWSYFS